MTVTIAVAGKGGTGKTTLSGMMIKYMCEHSMSPLLAVDADANANLNEVLGAEMPTTLGDIREEIENADRDDSVVPQGMSKKDYMEFKFGAALSEEDDYDLLVMGRTQGKGCYCFVNGLLQAQLQKVSANYDYIVVDNEAGMEHISRGILPKVDAVLLISDCSRRGIQAVGRIAELVESLGLNPKVVKLIVNRVPGTELEPGVLEEIAAQKLDLLGIVPQDEDVYRCDCNGEPTSDLPKDSAARAALEKVLPQFFAELSE